MVSKLSSSMKIANNLAKLIMNKGTIVECQEIGLGWIIKLVSKSEPLFGKKFVFEESGDIAIRLPGWRGWSSGAEMIRDKVQESLGKTIENVEIKEECIEIFIKDWLYMRIMHSDYSMDWEWTIYPESEPAKRQLSVVSEQHGKIWSRYPGSLARYVEPSSEFRGHNT